MYANTWLYVNPLAILNGTLEQLGDLEPVLIKILHNVISYPLRCMLHAIKIKAKYGSQIEQS